MWAHPKVRITSRDIDGARTTWIALTLGAADNIDALRARSPRIPLRDTAEVAGRRLADHLREMGWRISMGWRVTPVDAADALTSSSARETWRGARDESGYFAAYRVTVDDRLAETLDTLGADASESWTALEITGTATDPRVAAVWAVRSAERPAARAPIAGLSPLNGRYGPAISALDPMSADRLESTPVPFPEISTLQWPVGGALAIRT